MKKIIFWQAVFFILLLAVGVDPFDAANDFETAGAYKLFASFLVLILATAAAICQVKEKKEIGVILWGLGVLLIFPCGTSAILLYMVAAVVMLYQIQQGDVADRIIKIIKDGPYK